MATYGSPNVIVQIKDHGGTLRTTTAYVRAIGALSIEAVIQDATAFGDSWQKFLYVGIRKMSQFTLGGFYDDTATVGPDALYAGYEGDTRTGTVITIGSTKTVTVDTIIVKFDRLPKLSAESEYTVTLQPTGAVTEA